MRLWLDMSLLLGVEYVDVVRLLGVGHEAVVGHALRVGHGAEVRNLLWLDNGHEAEVGHFLWDEVRHEVGHVLRVGHEVGHVLKGWT